MKRIALLFLMGLGCAGSAYGDDTTNAVTTPAVPSDSLIAAFRTACEQGNFDQVKALIDQGAPVNGKIGKYDFTPVLYAATRNVDMLKYLIAHGAQIDATDSLGNTALNGACYYKKYENALVLLDAGANPNLMNQGGKTPLMSAARDGNDALVTALLTHHADINANSPNGSAIWWAMAFEHLSTLKVLLAAGADPNLKATGPIEPHNTLLAVAITKKNIEMTDLLLTHGAEINGGGDDGTTPLIEAVLDTNLETIQHLLDKGADPNLQDNIGRTALMLATNYQQEPGWQTLLDHGAKLETADKKGRTALIWACYYVYNPAIHFLIDHGADINAADLQGETPLTYAGDRGDTEMVQFLKDKGAKRTDVHIVAKDKPNPPLPPAHSWALAVGAIYAQCSGFNPAVLGYGDTRPVREIRERLKEDWDITDASSFLKTLDDLQKTGHRAGYQETGAKLAAMTDDAFKIFLTTNTLFSGAEANASAQANRDCYQTWKERTGLAWDLCRYANLVNQGYAAGYIENWEAWDMLLVNARQVQSSFSSWQEMSDNFLDARQIWAGARDPKFDACSKLLANPQDPNSPWTQNPWKTDLATPASN